MARFGFLRNFNGVVLQAIICHCALFALVTGCLPQEFHAEAQRREGAKEEEEFATRPITAPVRAFYYLVERLPSAKTHEVMIKEMRLSGNV